MTEQTTSPRPWKVINREHKPTKTCHHAYTTNAIVDANGRDVWMTRENAELIVRAVNSQGGKV